jgi:exopolysaccharide biosynthesis polyprenyl glycosylphosphotransferase
MPSFRWPFGVLRRHGRTLVQLLILADLTIVVGSLLVTLPTLDGFAGEGAAPLGLALAGVVVFFWCVCATSIELYESKRAVPTSLEVAEVWLCLFLATSLTTFVVHLMFDADLARRFLVAWTGIAAGSLLVLRVALRTALHSFRREGFNSRQVLLLGANDAAFAVAASLQQHPWFGYRIVGVLDDEPGATGRLPLGLRHLGPLSRAEEALAGRVVDEVICALPVAEHQAQVERIAMLCDRSGVQFHIVPDCAHARLPTAVLTLLGTIPILTLSRPPQDRIALAVKRAFDVWVSLVALVLASPVMLAIWVLIKLDSPGPVAFKQRRVGQNGRAFTMLKFRSMVVDAEARRHEVESLNEADGPVFKIRGDPRVTRVGAWLRRQSLDEVPQLINVLKGDMSLVGPRPPTPEEVAKYEWPQRRRLSMKPGITCLWQINGRSNVDFREWVDMDLHYIDHWSFWLDLRILLRTIPAVLSRRGAY